MTELISMNEMMAREIAAQSEILITCVAPLAERVAQIDVPAGRIFAGGCGDSAFAPAALGGVFAELGIDLEPRTSMELSAFTKFVSADTVLLSSISGGTKRTVEAANVARKAGAHVIALTCNGHSNLANAADETIVLPFTPLSRKTPHTLDYTVTLLALVALASAWARRPVEEISKLVETVPVLLENASEIAWATGSKINQDGKLFFLGAGPDLANANYGAAKFHEAGGIVAIAAETENFIHGMNFMVEPVDSVLLLAGAELVHRRSRQIATSFAGLANCQIVPVNAQDGVLGAFAYTLMTTFVLQYLCLNFANNAGLQVDRPRAGRPDGEKHLAIQSEIMAELS
ncbi:SIS domain-containing protein [Phyllobacterium endophyticum]|uniref:Glutamine--fructose-6-phosphate aminotransferase [isomerizing] n=2 Tax=Phyllobacterium endophyticum TaxID=1149773 RepID=A0A2P7AR72_9HYPH|nr:hypothetical protein CU100_14860 [Phyllobacterium endophyticum]TYR44362.1 SIS domain-containing protein [Phyllobacterium endophyticum]